MEQTGYKIRLVAGSPVLTIPHRVLRKLELKVGDVVSLDAYPERLIVKLLRRAPKEKRK